MKTVAFHNLGCKVNSYEIDVMQQKLQENGYTVVPFDTLADIYVINTCTVTNIADRKSRQMLHQAKKRNPDAIVVAVGCYVQTAEEKLDQDPAIDLAIGNNRKGEIAEILERYLKEREESTLKELHKEMIDINHTDVYEEMQLKQTADHTRAYIKIQDGCNQFCSYCVIPYARGRVRSRNEEDIEQEILGLVKKGFREVVLTGIHISSYGIDRGGVQLLPLLQRIAKIDGLERIRLGSLEPRIITRDFLDGIAGIKQICPHFHLSLQSGCDETLKRMNRRYSAAEFLDGVKMIRSYYPEAAITTDVIVGFPGETEAEFESSKAFLEEVEFYEMHVFKYSVRKGTRAAVMPDQVPDPIKTSRSETLLKLEAEMSHKYRSRYLGKVVSVLFEEPQMIDGRIYQVGHTPTYLKVAYQTEEDLSNRILEGRITDFLEPGLLCFEPRQ